MTKWQIEFTKEGEEDLDKLDKSVRQRVFKKILWLKDNFDMIIPLPLGGEWRGFFKLRIGDWRVIYEVEEPKRKITIHHIDVRDRVYKKRKR